MLVPGGCGVLLVVIACHCPSFFSFSYDLGHCHCDLLIVGLPLLLNLIILWP